MKLRRCSASSVSRWMASSMNAWADIPVRATTAWIRCLSSGGSFNVVGGMTIVPRYYPIPVSANYGT